MSRHIIWDWNCTLFDDFPAILAGANEAVKFFGGPELTEELYHATHTRPIIVMYERILGRTLTQEEFLSADSVFNDKYLSIVAKSDLRHDTLQVLERVKGRGWTQSILSMWQHHYLIDLLPRFDVMKYMLAIDGVKDLSRGQSKDEHIHEHLENLKAANLEFEPLNTFLVGDSLNDAVAATHAGIQSVLITGGMDARASLETAGVPVVDSLTEALDIIESA